MPTFTRYIAVLEATPPELPSPLLSWAQSGKGQARTTDAIGRVWQETYIPFNVRSVSGRAFLEQINRFWNQAIAFDLVHPDYQTPNGAGGGTPLVNGAGQTGQALAIDGATPNVTNWLRAGDLLRIGGLTPVYHVQADVSTDGTGAATLQVLPSIQAAPADNAALTITGVTIHAMLAAAPRFPGAGPSNYLEALTLAFREAP